MEYNTRELEKFKLKRLIKKISNFQGEGTSLITLVVPSGYNISLMNKLLTTEYGTASNIKSRVNKLSVLGAITSTQAKLKQYNVTPKNGLVLFCGTVIIGGKEKKVIMDIEPFKPINKKLYMCDNRFHTEVFDYLLGDDSNFCFIIIGGEGIDLYLLSGSNKKRIGGFKSQVPAKGSRRGGQSALRFARLRVEKRQYFIKKSSELCNEILLKNEKPIIKNIIIAGPANLKNLLNESSSFDKRLKKIILKIVDTSYIGDNGFNQAFEFSSKDLGDLKLSKELKVFSGHGRETTLARELTNNNKFSEVLLSVQ